MGALEPGVGRILGKMQIRTSVGGKGIVLSRSPPRSQWDHPTGSAGAPNVPSGKPTLSPHSTFAPCVGPKCHCKRKLQQTESMLRNHELEL